MANDQVIYFDGIDLNQDLFTAYLSDRIERERHQTEPPKLHINVYAAQSNVGSPMDRAAYQASKVPLKSLEVELTPEETAALTELLESIAKRALEEA